MGTVLILGASGKIGRHGAEAFQNAGWTVRTFNRKTDDMTKAARGVDVILNGLNPQNYKNWHTVIPAITAQVIAAAQACGATVIVPGNVYHFGDTPGTWSENTPARPVSRKGQIRLDMERSYAQSGVQTIILRAGNFIDPNRQGCPMSSIYLRAIQSGKITLPGPATTRQAMCYLPDWAKAAVQLAEMRGQLETFNDVPFPGHTLSANQIKSGLEEILEKPLRLTPFPWGVMQLLSPVWRLAYEMQEMRYLFETDHALSAERFHQLLPGFEATPLKTVLRASLPPKMLPNAASAADQPA